MFLATTFDKYIDNPLNNGQVKIYLETKKKIEYIRRTFVFLLSLSTSYFIVFDANFFGILGSTKSFNLYFMLVFLTALLIPLLNTLFSYMEVNLCNEHYVLFDSKRKFLSRKKDDFSFSEFPESIESEKGLYLKENILKQDRKPFVIEIFILNFYENEFKEKIYQKNKKAVYN